MIPKRIVEHPQTRNISANRCIRYTMNATIVVMFHHSTRIPSGLFIYVPPPNALSWIILIVAHLSACLSSFFRIGFTVKLYESGDGLFLRISGEMLSTSTWKKLQLRNCSARTWFLSVLRDRWRWPIFDSRSLVVYLSPAGLLSTTIRCRKI